MKLLVITNLFPNSQEPTRGIFNFQRFKALREQGVELKIVAPVPWHSSLKLPAREAIDGFDVYHPRYFIVPKIGRALYGFLFFLSVIRCVKKIDAWFKSEAILAAWAYPDAVGSFLMAKVLKKRIFAEVLGSDVNLQSEHFLRRAQIVYALSRSDKVIAVSTALKEKLVSMGVPAEKIEVVLNGVDTELFRPIDQAECRKKLGLPFNKKIIFYAGNFVEVKGVDILIEAFGKATSLHADTLLLLVGEGPLKPALCARVKGLGIENNVIILPRTAHDLIPYYMNACNCFVLSSRNEGCPNVVLESMACGTPVVGTRVGGVEELIRSDDIGILVEPNNANALAEALIKALEKKWDNHFIRERSLGYSWVDNAKRVYEIIKTSKG